MADSYVRFVDEAIRRFSNASAGLNDDLLDQDLNLGLMTARQLLVHCDQVISYIYEHLKLPFAACTAEDKLSNLRQTIVAKLQLLRDEVGDAGPSSDHNKVFRALADFIHHSGQLAIWPRIAQQ